MKGIATIQLFDAETGKEVQKLEKQENIITNAYKRYTETCIKGALSEPFRRYYSGCLDSVTPEYFMSGVALFQDLQTEDADAFLRFNGPLIGHAATDYAGAQSTRGDYNSTESGDLLNGALEVIGKRFVWDFGTDKANGVINSISMVPQTFGNYGFGYDGTELEILTMNGTSYNSGSITSGVRFDDYNTGSSNGGRRDAIGLINNRLYMYYSVDGQTDIFWYDAAHHSGMIMTEKAKPQLRNIVNTLDTGDYLHYRLLDGTLYGVYYDGTDGSYHLKTYDTDFITELSTVELDYDVYTPSLLQFAITRDHVYLLDTGTDVVIKMDKTTGTFLDTIALPATNINQLYNHTIDTIVAVYQYTYIDDHYRMYAYFMNADQTEFSSTSAFVEITHSSHCGSADDTNGRMLPINIDGSTPISFNISTYDYAPYYKYLVAAITPWVKGTINNLESPVVKDDTKTLKITYDIVWGV